MGRHRQCRNGEIMEKETIKLLHQEPLTVLEELLLAMEVKKNHISLKGDMNLCPTLAAGTVERQSAVEIQTK